MKKLLVILSLLVVNTNASSNEVNQDELCVISEKLCTTFQDESTYKYGFKDNAGNISVPALYGDIDIRENNITVRQNGLFGILDFSGKMIIPPKYNIFYQENTGENGFIIAEARYYAIMNKQGEIISPQKHYPIVQYITDDKVIFCENHTGSMLCGVMNSQGEMVIPPIYHKLRVLVDLDLNLNPSLLIAYNQNKKSGLLNLETGKLLTPFKYDEIENISDNRIKVSLNGKYGFIDTNGTEVIPTIYDFVEGFHLGLSLARKDGSDEEFYIDKTGKRVP